MKRKVAVMAGLLLILTGISFSFSSSSKVLINEYDRGSDDYIEIIATENNTDVSSYYIQGGDITEGDIFTGTLDRGEVKGYAESDSNFDSGATDTSTETIKLYNGAGEEVDCLSIDTSGCSYANPGGSQVYYRNKKDDTNSSSDWNATSSNDRTYRELNPGQYSIEELFAGGDGSSDDPYQISTCQQLQDMQSNLSANYILVNDLDCASFSFNSIGGGQFEGYLNGNYYEVSNLQVSTGIFRLTGSSGVISNIKLINLDGGETASNINAGLVGRHNGKIFNSSVSGFSNGQGFDHGGLVGDNQGLIENSYASVNVSGGSNIGGLVGVNDGGSIKGSYSTGIVDGSDEGGLVGENRGGTTSNSYWDQESSGMSSSAGGTPLNTGEMTGEDACSNMDNFDFQNIWSPVTGDYPEIKALGGSGSCNSPPEEPSLISPSDNADPLGLSPDLKASVSDPDGDSMDVTFHVDTDNDGTHEYTDTDFGVGSGGTASTSLSSLSESQVVDWYVVADDGSATTTSSEWSFTTVGSPDNPTSESPSDNAVDVSRSKNLQVDVNHPDNLDMTVEFFLDGSSIGSDTVTGGSGTASVNPPLGYSEDHSWSVDVDTQGYSTSSSGGSWSFETVDNTGLNSISGPSNDPAPLNPELEASVSHSDPGEELTVEFVNDDNGNVICSQSGVTDTESVTCDPSGEAFAGSTGTNYNWRVDLSGDRPSESYSSGVQSFTSVSEPSISLTSPNDGEENVATDSGLVANVNQDEGLELNTVITLEDDQGNFVDDYSMNSNPGQITFSDPNLELSENYQWYADTSIIDSTYSQGDTSGTRTFSTEHDFRVNGVYPSDGREAFGVNDSIDVEVFHSSDRSIDVEFYFNDTASGTPDVTKTVTSSGTAVNATVDTENFDGFGESTGTNYNWSYVVSDGASDTGDITDEGLNYTTVYRPELSLNSPNDGEVNVDIGGSLDIGVLQDDNIATDVTAQLYNVSGSETDVAVRPSILGTGAGVTASFSLDDFDFVEAGETYSYNATGTIINPADQVSSPIQGATGVSTFTISPKPEVIGIQPLNGKTGTSANPLLNVTADHDESDQMTVEFYDWEKTGAEAFLGEKTVASGDTASINISDDEIGDRPEVYRWYVNVRTESGTSWNNSEDPYEFTVSSIGSVEFDANTGSGLNLNPGNAADQGLDTIVGQETITFQVSNDVGADMPGIAFNVSDGDSSEVFGEVDDVESGSSVTVDLGESSLIEEDQESYEIYAFYQEAGTDFTDQDFRSDKIEFSTHVAEVEWINPGQPGSQPINEYRIYHNNQSGEAFSNFDYVGSINDDDSGSFTVGVANLELGESNSNECFRLVSWNMAGESDPTGEQCVGVVL